MLWMSPESLFDGVSSTKSDVWSYGVLLWEIVTCGERPYTGVATEALLDLIKDGYRMSIPLQCPQNLYQIMKSCWFMKVNTLDAAMFTYFISLAGLSTLLDRIGGSPAGPLPLHPPGRVPGPGAAIHPHATLQRREQRLQQPGGECLCVQHRHLHCVRCVIISSSLYESTLLTLLKESPRCPGQTSTERSPGQK